MARKQRIGVIRSTSLSVKWRGAVGDLSGYREVESKRREKNPTVKLAWPRNDQRQLQKHFNSKYDLARIEAQFPAGPEVPPHSGEPTDPQKLMTELRKEWQQKRDQGALPKGLGVSEYRQQRLQEIEAAGASIASSRK